MKGKLNQKVTPILLVRNLKEKPIQKNTISPSAKNIITPITMNKSPPTPTPDAASLARRKNTCHKLTDFLDDKQIRYKQLKINSKMEAIQFFSNPDFGQIRALTITNEPYFAVEDIARILGYKRPLRSLVRFIDREGETTCMTYTGSNGQPIRFTNELGVFTLIFGIDDPITRRFTRWFVSEILPTMQHQLLVKLESMNVSLRNENKHLTRALQISAHTLCEKDDRIGELKRRLFRATGEMMAQETSDRLYTVTEIGVMLDMSAEELNHILQQMGVQCYKHGMWQLRHHYRNFGYTRAVICFYRPKGKELTKFHTVKWTEKGMRFILQMVGKVDTRLSTAQ